MVSEEELAALFGITLETIINTQTRLKVHIMQTSAANKFICFPSLLLKR
jgi:hypothetical protein